MISLEDFLKKDIGTKKLFEEGWKVGKVRAPKNQPIEIEIISPIGRVYIGNRGRLTYEEHADCIHTTEAFKIAEVVEEYYARYKR